MGNTIFLHDLAGIGELEQRDNGRLPVLIAIPDDIIPVLDIAEELVLPEVL